MITALSPRETAIALIMAESASPSKTKRSLGVLYALCLAAIPAVDEDAWRSVNRSIRDANGINYLDHVKRIGWGMYEAVARGATP